MDRITPSLKQWLSTRHRWLQLAAARLLDQAELTDDDVSELTRLCLQEADKKFPDSDFRIHVGAVDGHDDQEIRLCSISKVEGVNALDPKSSLKFEKSDSESGKSNIVVVYGSNGSGKSGYVRLLKHVCGVRKAPALLGNVYRPDVAAQKARICFKQDNDRKATSYTWPEQGNCPAALNSVDIFDSSSAQMFLNRPDEARYEPPELSFFSSLIRVCKRVAAALKAKTDRIPSKKPAFPADKKETQAGRWYDAISAETSAEEIDKHCAKVDKTQTQRLQQRLAHPNPAEKAEQLRNQQSYLDTLVQDARKSLQQLSDGNCRRIIAARKKAILKRAAADTAANKMFADSELAGIGSEVWKELWTAARNYSLSTAYPEAEYPNVGEDSRCVLCHQRLTGEAKKRLDSFENFVRNETQQAATEAAQQFETASQTIEELPSPETLAARIAAAGISSELASQVMNFFAQLRARKNRLVGIDAEESVPAPLCAPKWLEEAAARSKSLAEQAEEYHQDAKSDHREEIKSQLNGLQAQEWLFEQRNAIEEEVTRLQQLSLIEKAQKSTYIGALSRKKGELAKDLSTSQFVQSFNEELEQLGASQMKVELVQVNAKGCVSYKIQLQKAAQKSVTAVLSEGEYRLAAMAAFLADVTRKSNRAPFIFDDPISSLDQDYEEAVVDRLCDLAANRQIIIFTHRLSLLATVRSSAKKKQIKSHEVYIHSVEGGDSVVDRRTGVPARMPFLLGKIESALNGLTDRCQQAEKAIKTDPESAENLRQSICSNFRMVVESVIETDLLCGVVRRFDRAIHSQKIRKLTKLKAKDCDSLDQLMSKYSKFVHSQPLEAPVKAPNLKDIKADIDELKKWRDEFNARKPPPVAPEAE